MDSKTYIIAEIGINHEGNVDICKWMVDAAAATGVDAVKLQTVDAKKSYVPNSISYDLFLNSVLSQDETADVFSHAKQLGLDVFTTCADAETADWVDKLEPSSWKISSGLLNHIPLIRHLAAYGRPMIVSTGLASDDDISAAISAILQENNEDIVLLHCTSLYPVPLEKVNLARMATLHDKFSLPVGFSDHSLGYEAAKLSVAAGSVMIEKHFTLDESRSGFDHHISLNPSGLREFVQQVRYAEVMMGSVVSQNELLVEQRQQFLRSVVASRDLNIGDLITKECLNIMRPAPNDVGAKPIDLEKMIGCTINRRIEIGRAVRLDDCDEI